MADYGWIETELEIRKLEKRITEVYSQAEKDIKAKIAEFDKKFKAKDAMYREKLKKGEITNDQYTNWVRGQLFQSKQWRDKRESIAKVLYEANDVATRMTNREKLKIFVSNGNYQAYLLEHGAGVNFGFNIYSEHAVVNLIKNRPQLLPEWKIDQPKDYEWNYKKMNSAITQGIIQGEKLSDITKRITKGLGSGNKNKMLTFARTAMTQAQNAGRLLRMEEALNKGIQVKKEWMATLDERTRYTHAELDGQKVDPHRPFKVDGYEIMYPGDPTAHPSMVYNCRCTLVGELEDYPAEEYNRYDNIDGVPIKAMSYRQWYNAKNGITQVDSFQTALGMAKTVAEVNKLMNSQGWFREKQVFGQTIKSEVDLTGCDLDSAKSIAASYEQVFEKFPNLRGHFDAPNAQPVGMKSDTYAWCFIRNGGKVQVNPKVYSNWSGVVNSYAKDVHSGFHPRGTTAESIVTHEIGHAIDGLLARLGVKGGVAADGSYRYPSSTMRNTIMKRVAKNNPESMVAYYMDRTMWDAKEGMTYAVSEGVSRYATKDNQEWFAECFAEYITSASPRPVAREFGKELEKLVEKIEEA